MTLFWFLMDSMTGLFITAYMYSPITCQGLPTRLQPAARRDPAPLHRCVLLAVRAPIHCAKH